MFTSALHVPIVTFSVGFALCTPVAFLLGLSPAAAEDKPVVTYTSIAECGVVKDDTERLKCFDAVLNTPEVGVDEDLADDTGKEDSIDSVDEELINLMQINLSHAQKIEDRTFAFPIAFMVAPGSEPPDMGLIMRSEMEEICPAQEDTVMRLRCFDEYTAEIFLPPQ